MTRYLAQRDGGTNDGREERRGKKGRIEGKKETKSSLKK